MPNPNPYQVGTQVTDVNVMIGRCSLDYQQVEPDRHPVNAGCSNFRYINNDQSSVSSQRHQRIKTDQRKQQKCAFLYFKRNPTLRQYRKEWKKFGQNLQDLLADQARMISGKGWFTDIKILEICGHIMKIHKEYVDQSKGKKIH